MIEKTLLEDALEFATEKHHGQVRKMRHTPYILHPMEVAVIISTMTPSEETIAAGLLHDVVEDCDVDPLEIRARFGPRVAALVASETEDKLSTRPPEETWMERKEESLLMLYHTHDKDVYTLWLADKLSNIRSFYREWLQVGHQVWSHLHQKDPSIQAWYYRTIEAYLKKDMSDTAAYIEYCHLVDTIFEGIDSPVSLIPNDEKE